MKALCFISMAFLLVACDEKVEPIVQDEAANEVFKRAFWKRPTSKDKIHHAERREWTDADGLMQWHWFLVLEPSPELVNYLCEDNAFGLVRADSAPRPPGAPPWFDYPTKDSGTDIRSAPRGNLTLVFYNAEKWLYASDSGSGFRPGISEPAKPPTVPPGVTGSLVREE